MMNTYSNFRREISTKRDIRELSLKVLHLKDHDTEAALTNNPSDIQSAAYALFRLWDRGQENKHQAYIDLRKISSTFQSTSSLL